MASLFTIILDNLATTSLTVSGGTVTIKNAAGTTIDTQTVLASASAITSTALSLASFYTFTFSGANGVPAGTYSLTTNLQDYTYVVSIPPGGISPTTAPSGPVLPSPNSNIEQAWITFYNTATASLLPAGITCTIAPSGGGTTVDTQVTNAAGQITSTKLQNNLVANTVYQVTFTGTGAPTGTFYFDPLSAQTFTVII